AAARFGNLFLLAMAVLGGLGLSIGLPSRGARDSNGNWRWMAILLVAIVNIEALRAPFTYQPFNGIPGLYKLLAQEPGPVVVAEQPFFPRWAVFQNAPYVLASTAHWRPLMNGYSGYTPEAYQQYAGALWFFPEEWAIKAMKDAGVTHVVVHPGGFNTNRQPVIPLIEKRSDVELLAIGRDNIRLYRLKR